MKRFLLLILCISSFLYARSENQGAHAESPKTPQNIDRPRVDEVESPMSLQEAEDLVSQFDLLEQAIQERHAVGEQSAAVEEY